MDISVVVQMILTDTKITLRITDDQTCMQILSKELRDTFCRKRGDYWKFGLGEIGANEVLPYARHAIKLLEATLQILGQNSKIVVPDEQLIEALETARFDIRDLYVRRG